MGKSVSQSSAWEMRRRRGRREGGCWGVAHCVRGGTKRRGGILLTMTDCWRRLGGDGRVYVLCAEGGRSRIFGRHIKRLLP